MWKEKDWLEPFKTTKAGKNTEPDPCEVLC